MDLETNSSRKQKKSSEADDRLTTLPDDVLCHILSFIPTIDSVSTCTLSTRMKHLWKHVSKLTFDDTIPPFNCRTKSQNLKFANFVNSALHVPKVLEKLSLSCYNDSALYAVRKWVSDSIMRDIQCLDLNIYNSSDRGVPLPCNLFTCTTLETLILKGSILVNLPTIVRLPKLRTLVLFGVRFEGDDGDHSGNLISSCSSLESLVVRNLIGFFTIASSTLRDVKFYLSDPSYIGYNPDIFCSALRRLNLSSFCSKNIRVPSNVFTSETLEVLILQGSFVIYAAKAICMPNLSFLELRHIKYKDDEIFSKLISSSISLESLFVERSFKGELIVSSCTLKVIDLKLDCSSNSGNKVVMNTPALKFLKIKSSGYADIITSPLASLEQVEIMGFASRSVVRSN